MEKCLATEMIAMKKFKLFGREEKVYQHLADSLWNVISTESRNVPARS